MKPDTSTEAVKALAERLACNVGDDPYRACATCEAAALLRALVEERDARTDAIRDIDAHATAMRHDTDGFVTSGYIVTVGALHRALALVGTAPECRFCDPRQHDCNTPSAIRDVDAWTAMLRERDTLQAKYDALVEAARKYLQATVFLLSQVAPSSPAWLAAPALAALLPEEPEVR